MQQEDIDIQIWAYIDGRCSTAERERIANLIATNTDWKRQYEEILQFNNTLSTDLQPNTAPAELTKKIMGKVTAKRQSSYSNAMMWGVRGVAAFFVIVICTLLLQTITDIDWQASSNTALSERNIQFTLPQLPDFNTTPIIMFMVAVLLLACGDMLLRNRARYH